MNTSNEMALKTTFGYLNDIVTVSYVDTNDIKLVDVHTTTTHDTH